MAVFSGLTVSIKVAKGLFIDRFSELGKISSLSHFFTELWFAPAVIIGVRNGTRIDIMPPADDFSEAAKIAHRAFIDMSSSKNAYFNRLAAIDAIYQAGGAPSLAENLELEKLLAIHDKNVLAFKTAIDAVTDDMEKQALFQLMS